MALEALLSDSVFNHWYVVLGAVFAAYWIISSIRVYGFKKAHKCKEGFVPDGMKYLCLGKFKDLYYAKNNGRLGEFLTGHFEEGKKDTAVLFLFGVRVIFTRDPENIKALLATQFEDFALGSRHAHLSPLLGDGIFTLDKEGWKNSRAMLRPQFAREQIGHVRSLEPHLQILAKHIDNSKGLYLDIESLFFKLTVDTATEFLFGESVHTLIDGLEEVKLPNDWEGRQNFAQAFDESQSICSIRAYLQTLYFLQGGSRFKKDNELVHKFADYYVQKALNTSQEELDKKSRGGYIFLYELVKQTRNPIILRDQLLNILLAGRDTTAGLLSFTFLELGRNPEVLEKLKKEIYENFGQGENARLEEITFESLKKCEYLKWVLNEALRLYPSVPVNFRVATKRTTLPVGGGDDEGSPLYVGKGTTVAYTVFATHRMAKFYGKDAYEFKPERWAEAKKLGWAYLPFNGGPRICLGQQFALTEASYVVTRLIQMFPHITGNQPSDAFVEKTLDLTMKPKNGVYLSCSR